MSTISSRLWRFAAIVFVMFAVVGREAPAQTAALNELSSDAIVDLSFVSNSGLAAILTRIEELDARLVITAAAAEQATVAAQSLIVPTRPNSSDGGVLEDAQSAVDRWVARIEVQERLLQLLEELKAAAQARREVQLLMAQEVALRGDWYDSTAQLRNEIATRLKAEALDIEQVPTALTVTEAPQNEGRDIWLSAAERDRLLIDTTATDRSEVEMAIADDKGALERALARLNAAIEDNTIRIDLTELSPADLALAQTDAELALGERRTAVEDRRGAASDDTAVHSAAFSALESYGLTTEQTQETEATTGGIFSDLHAAEAAVNAAEARIAFERGRLDRLDDARATIAPLQKSGDAYHASLDRLIEILARVAIIAQLTDAENAAQLQIDLAKRRDESFVLRAEARSLISDEARIDERRSTSEAVLAEAETTFEQRKAALEREAEWGRFIDAAQEMSNDALLAAYTDALEQVSALESDVSNVERALSRTNSRLEEARDAYGRFYNPIGIEVARDQSAFAQWRGTVGLAVPVEPATEDMDEPDVSAASSVVAPDEEGGLTGNIAQIAYREILAESRDSRDTLIERHSYYRDSADMRATLAAALHTATQSYRDSVDAQEQLLAATRQVWGAAAVLTDRIARGELDQAAVPSHVGDWQSRDRVLASEDSLGGARNAVAALEAETAELEAETSTESLIEALESMNPLYQAQIEALVSLLSFSEIFGQLDDVAKLDEFSQRHLAKEVTDRLEASHGIYGYLDNVLTNDHLNRIDELLYGYFERLILLERQVANLDDQRAQLFLVQEAADKLRPVTETVRENVLSEETTAQRRLDFETAAARATLAPENAAEILDELEARTGVRLVKADLPQIEVDENEDDPEAALAAAREALIKGLAPIWATAEGYDQWAVTLERSTEPLGTLDNRISRLEQISQQLVAQHSELSQRIRRLTGMTPEEEKELGEAGIATQRRFISGEIGSVQSERENEIQYNAMRSGAAVIVIPLVAVLVYMLGRLLAYRSFHRAAKLESTDGTADDRLRRAETLNGIFQTAWAIIVVIIASIYLLMAINVDIAPIVASLGVFGLAIAFGAQTIMRDLFAGFFLLMENQLNKGDLVDVNGVYGEVESIGLRITTIRARSNGMLHYVPNGAITDVANGNRKWWCQAVEIKVPFGVDCDRVIQVLRAELDAVKADPQHEGALDGAFLISGDTPTSIDYQYGALAYLVVFKLTGGKGPSNDFRRRVVDRFNELGIPLAKPLELALGRNWMVPVSADGNQPIAPSS